MTGIRDLLADVAAEAPPYDVTNRALRTARRQRRIAWTAPFVAVALAVAVVAATAPLRPSETTIDSSAVMPWLPERLAPENSPALLPGGPVGPAALAYARDDGFPGGAAPKREEAWFPTVWRKPSLILRPLWNLKPW